jgi:hypothetical protein
MRIFFFGGGRAGGLAFADSHGARLLAPRPTGSVVESLGFRVYDISERCFATSFSDFCSYMVKQNVCNANYTQRVVQEKKKSMLLLDLSTASETKASKAKLAGSRGTPVK